MYYGSGVSPVLGKPEQKISFFLSTLPKERKAPVKPGYFFYFLCL
jgi:hypothetical protein